MDASSILSSSLESILSSRGIFQHFIDVIQCFPETTKYFSVRATFWEKNKSMGK